MILDIASRLWWRHCARVRPAELKKGVMVSIDKRGRLLLTVQGAKVTRIAGQPERRLLLQVDNPIAATLREAVKASGSEHGLAVQIASPKAMCAYVRRLSKRLFPTARYVASPYSFRHGFSADQKAKKVPADELARMMGHVSDSSQRNYGVARQGRRPLSHVITATATRPVRHKGAFLAERGRMAPPSTWPKL